ncbi:MAG: hypothetical protein AAF570_27355 [Bacteroidota bacterium]
MNWLYIIAGIFLCITGFVHLILGEKWLFSKLRVENLETHYSGEVTKTTLRWFWHFGSFMVLLVATTALLMGLTDGLIPAEDFMGKFLAIIYLGLNSLLIALHLPNPSNLKEYPQLIIMVGIMVLLFLGSNQSMT